MSEGWSRDVKFNLVVFNQFNRKMTKEGDTESCYKFNEKQQSWGYDSLMALDEFHNPQGGFVVNDACIIWVEVSVLEAINEKRVIQTVFLKSGGQTGHTDSASIGELIDFRGLGEIENVFVPLLEEVCSQHPSLVECHQKRSRKFIGWAFNALGRVLYFLKTKKLKDMNDLAFESLQTLWEELEIFDFDLTWLEPHVQCILGMKCYVEKVMQVEKLKENAIVLELESERVKAELVAAEVNLDVERDLLKAKGFQVKDLDAELGYGSCEVMM